MDAWLAGHKVVRKALVYPQPPSQAVGTSFLWEAECLEDPELAARLEAALPEDVRAELHDDREVLELEEAVYGPGVDPPVEWPRE